MFLAEEILPELVDSNPFESLISFWNGFWYSNFWNTEFENQWNAVNGDVTSLFE